MSLLTFKNRDIQDNAVTAVNAASAYDNYASEKQGIGARMSGLKSNAKSSLTNPIKENDKKDASKRLNKTSEQNQQNQIISGYFVKEKSYKEMVIARVNNFLCGVLALLVMVCLVSYYYVINGEIQLNQIRKETLAINYENEDMQHRLDILQSFSNVDRQVTKTKILQTAKQVMELSAANLPNVNYENKNISPVPGWSMGY